MNQALAIQQKYNYQLGIARTYHRIAVIKQNQGDNEKAKELYTISLNLHKKNNNLDGVSKLLNSIGSQFLIVGELDSAVYYFQQFININIEIGNKESIAIGYANISCVGSPYKIVLK